MCGWDLVASHILSGDNDNTYPTHDLVMNHGQLDYWESGSEKLKVVLRADYVCLSAEYDNDDQLQSSTWGWKIPLGVGAVCSSGKTHTPNLTYGGNEVVFEIDEGDPGGAEDVFKDGCIWHGADTVSVGQQVSPETVYINLHWDYQSKCVIGELSDTPDQGSYTQDGILHRSIYVAKCAPFTPSTMAKVGDLADGELVEHGTFGDFTQDGPKMDSYCQHDSNVRFQSIEWDNLGGQVVNCQVQQLHGFSDLENHTDADEEDQLVVRRKDDDGGAEIRYVDLSSVVSSLLSAEVQTDTDSPNTDLSSIQWTDDDGGNPVLQLFKFDDHEAVEAQDSDEVVVKRGDGVEYVQLSTIVVSGDTNQGNIGKSIETTEDGNGNKYHQLYKFDGGGLSDTIQVGVQLNGNAESLVPDEYEFVLRKNGASGEIEYAKIELSAFDAKLSADSDVGAQKSIDIDSNVIQLHDMDEAGEDLSALVPHCFAEPQDPLSSLSAEFVVRKGGAGGEIGYVSLDLLQDKTPLDRNTYHTQKSLQYATIDNLSFLELNGFHSDATSDVPVAVLSSDAKPLLPANWQFLTRHKDQNGYWQLGYSTLSAMVSGALSVNVDSDVVAQKSLEWAEDDGQEYLQLYGMDVAGRPTEQVDLKLAKTNYHDLLPDDEEFVIRTGVGGEIIYKNVAVTLSAFTSGTAYEISGDTNVAAVGRKSIQTVEDNMLGEKYHQLYNFDSGNIVGCYTTVLFDEDVSAPVLPTGTTFVVRQPDGNGGMEIGYMELSAKQAHEKLDSGAASPRGYSLEYASYYRPGDGCENRIQLWEFDYGCAHHVTSAETSAYWGNSILYRNTMDGCTWTLGYMSFDSVKEFVPENIGDSQLNPLHYQTYNKSINKYWDGCENLGRWAFELYDWQTGYDHQSLTIYNNGCTYYWPQNDRTDSSPTEWDYILVKHVDSNGNQELQYKLLEVTMPNITDYGSDISDIYNHINNYYYEIQYLSSCIDDLSGQLSGNYWESGGDSGTCYGSNIADSNQIIVIDLDNKALEGDWDCNGTFYADYFDVGCSISLGNTTIGHNNIHLDGQYQFVGGCSYFSDGYLYVNGSINAENSITAGCGFYTGCAYFTPGCAYIDGTFTVGCSLVIGCTSLSESQLSALLALI